MKAVMWMARVHLDNKTHEVPNLTADEARTLAETWMKAGVWIGDKLYPPSTIIYAEVLEKEL